MNLPKHITKKSETWFYNTKTAKYIHKDNIEVFLERYWDWHSKKSKSSKDQNQAKSQAIKFTKEIKQAENRWFGKND